MDSSLWRITSFVLAFVVSIQYYYLVFKHCPDRSDDPLNDDITMNEFTIQTHDLQPNTFMVFILTSSSVVSSLAGGLPFFFIKNLSPIWICFYNSVAAGMMFSASLSLALDAMLYSNTITLIGIFSGVLFVFLSDYILSSHEDLSIASLKGKDAKKVLIFIGVMTIHSLAEGIGMGMSFGGGTSLGLFVNIAMAIHNFPEGIAVALVLVSKGISPLTATMWAAFSAIPQPLMAIPAFWFVETFTNVLPFGLSFSAGAMVWMIFTEMVPEAYEAYNSHKIVLISAILSFLAMECFQVWLDAITN